MSERTLIDAIVRQTVVLIAQLATAGGVRAPLAHLAEQVFLDLAAELERQGVTRSVGADMFGMALRTYQRRTQRLEPSETERGRSLWEAVLEHVRDGGVVRREDVFQKFRRDDEVSLRAVLRDLTESGLVFSSGTGKQTVYRVTTDEEMGTLRRADDRAALEALVWSVVFREGPAELSTICTVLRAGADDISPVLDALVAEGRVERIQSAGKIEFRSRVLVLGMGDPAAWEASVLDHFSALVRTIGRKLSVDQKATPGDEVGGSTYHYTLHRGHPMEAEVLGELGRFRERSTELRERLRLFNLEHGLPPERVNVTAYFGQCVVENEHEDAE